MTTERDPDARDASDGPIRINGRQLHFALRAAGISQEAFAQTIGVTPGHVSRILRGQRGVTVDTMDRILRAFGDRLSFRELRAPEDPREG